MFLHFWCGDGVHAHARAIRPIFHRKIQFVYFVVIFIAAWHTRRRSRLTLFIDFENVEEQKHHHRNALAMDSFMAFDKFGVEFGAVECAMSQSLRGHLIFRMALRRRSRPDLNSHNKISKLRQTEAARAFVQTVCPTTATQLRQ